MTVNEVDPISVEERNENFLFQLKSQVKAVMEEAVTKKFVHEESTQVLRLCGTVETCLLDGLRRRIAGFLRINKIASLFTKVGKSLPEVGQLVAKIEDVESSFDKTSNGSSNHEDHRSNSTHHSNGKRKFLWVRMALTSKQLDHIVAHLVANNSKYYEKRSIMADPVRGEIFASLLVGPCALDFTKMKTHDNYWSDPPAGELLQRHRLHSRHATPNSPVRRLAINTSSMHNHNSTESPDRSSSFREYVESLHQNSKMTLLYGKNNVVVQPQEEVGPIPGYLSLHQEINLLVIKWTPNQLMNVKDGSEGNDGTAEQRKAERTSVNASEDSADISSMNGLANKKERPQRRKVLERTKSSYWEFAISVNVRDVVYLHCHQQATEKMGTLVLVGQDGVQWPPIRFPPGGHLLAFLSCLETGLLPHGYLDPPLWSQEGKGKIFPHLRRKSNRRSETGSEYEEPTDFVFRVNSSSDSSYVVAPRSSYLPPVPNNTKFDLMDSIFTLPSLITASLQPTTRQPSFPKTKKSSRPSGAIARSVVLNDSHVTAPGVYVQPPCRCSKCRPQADPENSPVANGSPAKHKRRRHVAEESKTDVTWDSTDGFVPHLDMYSWDQNHPRHYDNPEGSKFNSSSYSGSSLRVLCDTMRRQIISRAFYGWLAHCRHLTTVRTHLSALVNDDVISPMSPTDASGGVDDSVWGKLNPDDQLSSLEELTRYVYYGGVKSHLRATVWPYLLKHYPPGSSNEQRELIDAQTLDEYEHIMEEWLAVEAVIKLRDQDLSLNSVKSSTSRSSAGSSFSDIQARRILKQQSSNLSDVFPPEPEHSTGPHVKFTETFQVIDEAAQSGETPKSVPAAAHTNHTRRNRHVNNSDASHVPYSSISTASSMDANPSFSLKSFSIDENDVIPEEGTEGFPNEEVTTTEPDVNSSLSAADVTSQGSLSEIIYSEELLDNFALNLHRIEKDVQRCDRNHAYFAQDANLDKLRNVICCYVWRHLDIGYMQGMCDIAAPLLLVMEDESLVYSCFLQLMQRMGKNFPNGGTMDLHFANMRSLIQILDAELFEHMHKNGDYTHFYFCYRWFLLDFKRELSYDDDVFSVWERIWAARHVSSEHFVLFFALAMLKTYREIIIENDMDFTDIIKFFNEMAEKHDARNILSLAQNLLAEVQQMMQKEENVPVGSGRSRFSSTLSALHRLSLRIHFPRMPHSTPRRNRYETWTAETFRVITLAKTITALLWLPFFGSLALTAFRPCSDVTMDYVTWSYSVLLCSSSFPVMLFACSGKFRDGCKRLCNGDKQDPNSRKTSDHRNRNQRKYSAPVMGRQLPMPLQPRGATMESCFNTQRRTQSEDISSKHGSHGTCVTHCARSVSLGGSQSHIPLNWKKIRPRVAPQPLAPEAVETSIKVEQRSQNTLEVPDRGPTKLSPIYSLFTVSSKILPLRKRSIKEYMSDPGVELDKMEGAEATQSIRDDGFNFMNDERL
uniref:Small G protein signaling modulator 1 n=1 Tax=Phallusia mammillata TaxID=59560 RepID=A0A6F9DRG2_9ASCI|nr:small G protein signaling modulator 1 [Phallusia mammillata]